MNSPKRLLIVRLSALGDIIHTLPLMDALKQSFPGIHLGWLVESGHADLLRYVDGIDTLHISHRKKWLKAPLNPVSWQQSWRLLRDIKAQQYDTVLDTQGLLKSALPGWLAGIPQRVGMAFAREGAASLYTHALKTDYTLFDPNVWVTQHYVDLLQLLGGQAGPVSYPLSPSIQSIALSEPVAQWLADTASHPLIALAPSTLWQSKHWPEHHWQALITLLATQSEARLVLVGGPGDTVTHKQLVESLPNTTQLALQSRFLDATGLTTVSQLAALLAQAHVVIASDSGPLHLAGALSTQHPQHKPTVMGLFGPTSPRRTPAPMAAGDTLSGNLSLSPQLSCQPCHQKRCTLVETPLACLEQLSPDLVFNRIIDVVKHARISLA